MSPVFSATHQPQPQALHLSSSSMANTTTPPTMPLVTPTPAWGQLGAALPGPSVHRKRRGTSDDGPLLRNISKPRCCHHRPTIAKPGQGQMPREFSCNSNSSTLCIKHFQLSPFHLSRQAFVHSAVSGRCQLLQLHYLRQRLHSWLQSKPS